MTKVLIYGASDDLVEVVGDIEGADEFNVYDKGWKRRLLAPNGDSLIVRAQFGKPKAEADWHISIETTDTYPSWPVAFTERPDREGDPALTIEVPEGTALVKVKK